MHINETQGYAALSAKKQELQAEIDANGWTLTAQTLKQDYRECLRDCAQEMGLPDLSGMVE